MDWLGSVAGGVASGALGVIGSVLGNQQNAQQASRMMNFQAEMSSNAHQREVADLRAAGLNPILSANQGASAPAGAQAKMENVLAPGVSSAVDAMRLSKELNQADSSIALNTAQGIAATASANKDQATADNTKTNTALTKATMGNTIKKSDLEGGQADINKRLLRYDSIMNRVNREAGSAKSLMQLIPRMPNLGKDESVINTQTGEIIREGRP